MREIVSPLDGIRSPFGFIRGGGVVPFSPSTLFASGEEGAWYEPSTTTAFRSTTDLTPCGFGDSCGFLLDKSQGAGYSGGSFTGLGSELVTNGTFDTDTDWTKGTGWTISGGAAVGASVPAFQSLFQSSLGLVAGRVYRIRASISASSGGVQGYLGTNGSSSSQFHNADGSVEIDLVFTYQSGEGDDIAFRARSTGFTGTIDNISVRELPGNHAVQATEAARPILARVPSGGRRNLLERTEEFDDAVWSKVQTSVSANAIAAPDGTTTAEKLTPTTTNAAHYVRQVCTVTNATHTYTVYAKASGYNFVNLQIANSSAYGKYFEGVFNLSTGTVETTSRNLIYTGSRSITELSDGWYRCEITVNNIDANSTTIAVVLPYSTNDPTTTYAGDGTSGIYIWGAQLEAASTATAYQKVVDQYDITEAGVTSLEYLAFDGSDDGMATASIDFTATDKMSVFAGVEKESDAAAGTIVATADASATNTGVFFFNAPGASPVKYSFGSKGTALAGASTSDAGFSALTPNVVTGISDISGDTCVLRIDGTQISESTSDQGTGNFRNGPLYIGVRTSSLFFDGKLFSLIVRGAASTAGEISQTESYLAAKSGVTL